jgi:hypothetical protein
MSSDSHDALPTRVGSGQAAAATSRCPVCGSGFPASTGRGRPRIFCGNECRWASGHQAAAERRRQREAGWSAQTYEDLMAWAGSQDFGL